MSQANLSLLGEGYLLGAIAPNPTRGDRAQQRIRGIGAIAPIPALDYKCDTLPGYSCKDSSLFQYLSDLLGD
ncbi:MAG: hypothetical protein VKK04_11625 [Synechococcales bacterium]|nr:hypothetical protein [Synechococcales bacterium]